MPVEISSTAIGDFLATLPEGALGKAAPTYLPTALPLAFPSELHHVNFLVVLHLVNNVFVQPKHLAYFAGDAHSPAPPPPGEAALRGVLGMFLASEPDWTSEANLLGARAWGAGALTELKISEFFGIAVMRERPHETMPALRVGERHAPAAALATELVDLFAILGDRLSGACLGEEVVGLLTAAKDRGAHDPDPALTFVRDFGRTDLAYQFGADNVNLPLPALADVANISPLPLPLPLMLHLGILIPSSDMPGADALRHVTGDWWAGRKVDLDLYETPAPGATGGEDGGKGGEDGDKGGDGDKGADKDDRPAPPKIVGVSKDTLAQLSEASVEACRVITSKARFGPLEWQHALTERDVARICAMFEGVMDARGMGVRLTLE